MSVRATKTNTNRGNPLRKKQLECRVVLTFQGRTFAMGMYCPATGRYEPLGNNHPTRDSVRIVGELRDRIAREGHRVTFSEVNGKR